MFKTKKFGVILLLTSTCLIYNLPYLSSTFYTQFLEAFNLSNTQAGILSTFFSLTATPGYLFGGMLADKFSPKKLIILSLLMTAALGYAMYFMSGYTVLMVCYFGFGISTTFIHWSAFMKLIRAQADDKDDQGRTFGTFEWCYALVGAVASYGLLALLGYVSSFKIATALYATILVIIALLVIFLLKDVKGINDNDFNVRMVKQAIAHPVTWLNGLIVMGMFIVATGSAYLNPYLNGVFGTSVAFATSFAIMNKCIVRLCVVGVGGMLLDKWKTPKFMIICMVFLSAAIVGMFVIPQNSGSMVIAVIIAFLILIFMSTARSGMYTPIPEAKIPMAITGTAMGICSAVGYSTDIWSYTLIGNWLDNYGNTGYQYVLLLSLAGVAMVIICSILLYRYEKRHHIFERSEV